MDENKTGDSRKRRVRAVPRLESLEGRQLMAANAQVGIKEVLNQGVLDLIITGTNKADVIQISDNGTNLAGNITIALGGGRTYTSTGAVGMIEVLGKGGVDQINYDLTGNLLAARTVLVDLGSGNDAFTANLTGAIATADGLDLEAYGGTGNDRMTINQTGWMMAGTVLPFLEGDSGNDTLTYNGSGVVGPGTTVLPGLSGGAGNDKIQSKFAGVIAGNYIYNLTIDGGAGNDVISNDIRVMAGSPGTVGTDATTPAVVLGGAGNDKISYSLAVDPGAAPLAVNAVAVGGAGKDIVQHTGNVLGDPSNEKDSLVS
ncbi:hypothetical protein P12x_002322 [Tundrisphaera lichenicola]|uniref:hypothetical protein n=1 Tax=Tundrisphaera lichenicola TaxID=2029860 RepID=UPI003EB94B97